MHELGIMIEIVKTVERIAQQNNVTAVDTLVLQIGQMSPVVPSFIESCYPAAKDGTLLENTKLKIEMVPGKEFMIKEIIAC